MYEKYEKISGVRNGSMYGDGKDQENLTVEVRMQQQRTVALLILPEITEK